MKESIIVNDLTSFEFWLGMLKLRNKTWQRETLKRLKKKKSVFETWEENADKIKALTFLLK